MPDLPSFEEFFKATHGGWLPFPWQSRLAATVAEGGWPSEIGVPTGLGKTACIDIAVWELARQAHLDPISRTAATRTWYVVNRRLLVDAAYDHGESLRRWLADPATLRVDHSDATRHDVEVLEAIATRLLRCGRLGSDHGPLHVTRLRGGADLGARVPDPSQPALVFATVPMFASRWLFSGYGSSISMRPVDAALAGIDSLVLLDEAHLARPLAGLVEPLAECDPGDPARVMPRPRNRPCFVALTATGEQTGDRLDIDDDDRAHPIVQKRLTAHKPTRLIASSDKELSQELATTTTGVVAGSPHPSSCIVFTNTPDIARRAFDLISTECHKEGIEADIHLLTGRMREREAAIIREVLLDTFRGAPSSRPDGLHRERHLIVVATQSLEVGADLDFEHLVTQTAGVRAIVQRLGRLNRLGRFPWATASIIHTDDVEQDPVYGKEPLVVWERLSNRTDLNLNPDNITEALGEPQDAAPKTGELLPHHLWDWAKTCVSSPTATPPEVFYDPDEQVRRVSVIWRTYLPTGDQHQAAPIPAPSGDEAAEIPIHALRTALKDRSIEKIWRLAADARTIERTTPDRIRPGNQVLLPTRVGLYDRYGWNPDSRKTVLDLSLDRAGLVLTPEVLDAAFDEPPSSNRNLIDEARTTLTMNSTLSRLREPPDDGTDQLAAREELQSSLSDLIETITSLGPPQELTPDERLSWEAWRQRLITTVATRGLDALTWIDDSTPYIEVPIQRRHRDRAAVRSDSFDELSFINVDSPHLEDHLETVGELAAGIGRRIGIPANLVEAVRQAGTAHDFGKLEPRFQRWLDPDAENPGKPLAKSATPLQRIQTTRNQSGWPQGGRHELLSSRLLQEVLDPNKPTADLIIHLVASHHGQGRPTIQVVDDPNSRTFSTLIESNNVTLSGDLSAPDWTQPGRFRRLCEQYGYWGLALLEAVVRQADHAASARVEVA